MSDDIEVPDGYLRDTQGRLVPRSTVKTEHLLEDDLVRRIAARAEAVSAQIAALRRDAMAEIEALMTILREQYGVQRGGRRGNMTLSSYDGAYRVQIAVGDFIEFGPELQVAKGLIDQCIHRWSDGGNENLLTLVNDAFAVDKEGKLQTDRILGLRRHKIDDEEWKIAMDAIGDAVRVKRSKEYLRFYRRGAGAQAAYMPVPLDIARVEG